MKNIFKIIKRKGEINTKGFSSNTMLYLIALISLFIVAGVQMPSEAKIDNPNEIIRPDLMRSLVRFENIAKKNLSREIWNNPEKVVSSITGYELKLSGAINTKLPKCIGKDSISLVNKNNIVTFKLLSDSDFISTVINNRIYYFNPKTKYIFCYYRNEKDNQLREFIFIDKKPEDKNLIKFSWRFRNAQLKNDDDGEIILFRENIEQTKFRIPKPFYIDSKGDQNTCNVEYVIENPITLSLIIKDVNDISFPILVDPTINASQADIKFSQFRTIDNTYAGSMSSAGDFNGDGFEDLIIGHSGYENYNGEKIGRAYIYLGGDISSGGSPSLVSIFGENDGDYFGWSVSGIGDFNKDGLDDVLVGATGAETCYIFFGSTTTGLRYARSADITIVGEHTNSYLGFGYSVSGVGDYNGDGYDDVVLADWSDGVVESKVYILYGFDAQSRISINASESNIRITQGTTHSGFHSVSTAGDFNGDGLYDFIVGAPFTSDGAPSGGTAYIFYGKSGLNDVTYTRSNADVRIVGQSSGVNLGEQVSSAGDYNGDGFNDILIGTEDNGAGTAYVFYGGNITSGSELESSNADVTFKGGGTSSNYFGNKVAGAGDFNGDGYDDVIIGAPNDDGYGTDSGSAYLFYGRPALPGTLVSASDADQRYNGRDSQRYLGWSLAGVHFNDDRFSDVVVGTPWDYRGYAFMFYGHLEPIQTDYPAPAIPPTSEVKRNQAYHGTNPCQSVEASPGPVFVESGDFYYEYTDIFIKARGIPINTTRYYNTQDLFDGPFGHGWNMDYTTQLVKTEEEDVIYATVRRGSGLRVKFTDNSDGTFSPPLGSNDTLVENPDGTFTFNGDCDSCKRKISPAYHFNSDGSLHSIEDLNANAIIIGYDLDGRISMVTDANGRSLTFSYGINGRVENISDFSSPPRTWNYGYDEDDNLTTVTDPLNNTVQYQYDEQHNLTAIIDGRGNTVSTVSYDEKDKVTGFMDRGGDYEVQYDPVSQVTTKVDPKNKVFSFDYDDKGNITDKLDPLGNALKLSWDDNVNVTGKENAKGIKTDYTYDDRGNILTITKDSGEGGLNLTTTYEYDDRFDKVAIIIPPLGASYQNSFVYDENGNLRERHTPSGISYFEYNSYGNIIQATEPDGYITSMEYDSNGYMTRLYIPNTDPIIETTYTYDERGNILTKTDPNGNTTTYHYDRLDRLDWYEDATPNHNRTSFEYDANGNLVLITDPLGVKAKYEYDAFNQLTKKIDAYEDPTLARESSYEYDNRGNLVTVTDPLNHATSYEYDEINRLKRIVNHLGNDWEFEFDPSGNLISKKDPNENVTSYTYDSLNRLKTVTDAELNKTTYNYDDHGRLLSIIDANDNVAVRNTYNTNDRLATTIDPVQPTPEIITYTPSGRIQTKTDGNGTTTTYTFQTLTGRLEKIQYEGGREEIFTYDLNGNVLSVSDNHTGLSVSYTYDQLNRIISEAQLGQTLTFTYNNAGKRDTMAVPGMGTFTYQYDSLYRLTHLTNHLNQVTSYEYLANDLRSKVTYSNGATTEYDYDTINRLGNLAHKKSDGSIIDSYSYAYDDLSNRLSEQNFAGNTITYSYNKIYQLKTATYPDKTISYSYDGVGNRLGKVIDDGVTTSEYVYEYDEANRLVRFTDNPGFVWFNVLYDDDGKVVNISYPNFSNSYTYDQKNQLSSYSSADGFLYGQFLYDPTGRRVWSEETLSDNIWHLYDGKNILKDICDTSFFQVEYTPGVGIDDIVSYQRESANNYYLRDGLNSVRLTLNEDQTTFGTNTYKPFGAIDTSNVPSRHNIYTYTGRRSHSDSTLMYYRNRYYDVNLGRFTQKDKYKGFMINPLSLNRYVYVKNNPINLIDPLGYFWKDWSWLYNAGIGGGAGTSSGDNIMEKSGGILTEIEKKCGDTYSYEYASKESDWSAALGGSANYGGGIFNTKELRQSIKENKKIKTYGGSGGLGLLDFTANLFRSDDPSIGWIGFSINIGLGVGGEAHWGQEVEFSTDISTRICSPDGKSTPKEKPYSEYSNIYKWLADEEGNIKPH